MSARCGICSRQDRDQIDQALARGQSVRAIAARFDASGSAVQRHRQRHVRPQIVAAARYHEGLRLGGLAARLADLADTAQAVRQSAMATGDAAIVLRSIDSERGVIGDLARILGLDANSVAEALREAEVLGDAVADLARQDSAFGRALIAELDQAGSAASADLASALRDWMARPKPSLTAIPVAGDRTSTRENLR